MPPPAPAPASHAAHDRRAARVEALVALLNALVPPALVRAILWLALLGRRLLTPERLEAWWRRRLVCSEAEAGSDNQARFSSRFHAQLLDAGCFPRLAGHLRGAGRWRVASQLEALGRVACLTGLRHALLRRGAAVPPLMEVQLATCVECDLSCAGCYSARERAGGSADGRSIRWMVREAARAGAAAVHFLGKGEPFLDERRGLELVRIASRWPHLLFTVATNGTHLTARLASALARTPNALCLVSVDGPEPLHDGRRGAGTYGRALEAMRLLRRSGAAFGFSCTVTRANASGAASPAFVGAMRAAGACLGVYTRFFSTAGGAHGALALDAESSSTFARSLQAAHAGAGMPLFDLDELEEHTGCRARAGLSVYLDGVTGRVSPCIKVPVAPAACRLEGRELGELARVLRHPFFEQYRGGRCASGCSCGGDLAAEQRAVDSECQELEGVVSP